MKDPCQLNRVPLKVVCLYIIIVLLILSLINEVKRSLELMDEEEEEWMRRN